MVEQWYVHFYLLVIQEIAYCVLQEFNGPFKAENAIREPKT